MAQKNQNLKLKELKELALMKEILFTFQQKHSIHMVPLIQKKEFSHIAINILPKKNATYKTTWYESDFRNVKLQKLFKNNVNKRRFKN